MSELISIIMPNYNGEEFLDEAISSLVNQTYENFELIVVDDGSKDNSVNIIKKWCEADSRVKLLEQKNQYAGVARNNGIDHAQGEYVICLDSDDVFHTQLLEKLYKTIVEQQADISVCEAYDLDYQSGKIRSHNRMNILDNNLLADSIFYNKYTHSKDFYQITGTVSWNKLIRRSLIDKYNIRYQAVIRFNDVTFTTMALFFAEKIAIVHDRLIDYRVNKEMNISNKKANLNSFVFDAYEDAYAKLVNQKDFELVKKSFLEKEIVVSLNFLSTANNYATFKTIYDQANQIVISKCRDMFTKESDFHKKNNWVKYSLLINCNPFVFWCFIRLTQIKQKIKK